MKLVIRKEGSRRNNPAVEFPLMDSQGIVVLCERRQLSNRRKAQYGIDDLKVILAKMIRD